MRVNSRILLSAAIASSAFNPVMADDGPSFALEEIVVTARKRAESMQDVPIAVTAMNGDQLDAQGLFSLQDFGQGAIPSLRVQPFPSNPSTLIVTVRGIGQADAGQVTREAGVGIYVDGVYLGRSQGLGSELANIQSIEVLRGPQGTLFGRNAVGGAVSFTTKAPTGEFGIEQTIGTGSENHFKALTRLSLPEVAGVSAKIDFMRNKRDGWVENTAVGAEDYNAYDKEGYRVSLLWDVAGNFNVKYAYDSSNIETSQNYFQFYTDTVIPGVGSFNNGNERKRIEKTRFDIPLEPSETEQSGHALIAEWDVSDELTIKSISSYRELEEDLTSNYGGVFGMGFIDGSQVDQDQWSQEIQFIGTALNGSIEYAAGVYYYEEDVEELAETLGSFLPDPSDTLASFGVPQQGTSNFVSVEDYFAFFGVPGITVVPSPITNIFGNYFMGAPMDLGISSLRQVKANTQSSAVFGQFTWTPSSILDERLHLTFGLRYTEDEKTGSRPIHNGLASDQRFDLKTDSLDPTFTAAYDYSVDGSVYFRYATAYKAAGTNLRSATFASYDQEELESYELGLKSVFFDRRIELNTAAFWSKYSDRQIDFSNPFDISISETINATDDIDIYGFEMDARAILMEGLTANVSYVYLGKNNPLQADTVFGNGALTRFVLPQLPRHAGSLSLDYAFPSFPIGDLSAHLNIVSASKSYYAPRVFVDESSDYTVVNARLTLSNIELGADSNLKLAAWVHNLTDEEYVSMASTEGSAAFNAPRMSGIDLTFTY